MRGGPYPAAVAATSPEARRERSAVERLWLRCPPGVRRLLTRWVLSERRSPLRDRLMREGLRHAYGAWSRRDWELNTLILDADFAYAFPDEEFKPPDFPTSARGVDEYVALSERVHDAWDEMRIELLGVLEARPDRVVTRCRLLGRGIASGITTELGYLDVLGMREGLCVSQTIREPEAGRRELGLAPARSAR